ncbi:MAG: sulfatase [Planctomycetota bacterium]
MAEAEIERAGPRWIIAGLATGLALALGDGLLESSLAPEGFEPALGGRFLSFALLPALGLFAACLTSAPLVRRLLPWLLWPVLAFAGGEVAARGGKAQTLPLATMWNWLAAIFAVLLMVWIWRSRLLRRFPWLAVLLGAVGYAFAALAFRGLYDELRAVAVGLSALALFSGLRFFVPAFSRRTLVAMLCVAAILAGFGGMKMRSQDIRDWAEVSTTALAPVSLWFDLGRAPEKPPPVPEDDGDFVAFFGSRLDQESRARFVGKRGPIKRVLFLVIDALRADMLGRTVAGKKVTPVLDALAAEAVVFENAYTPAPYSQLALISIFSGLYPGRAVERLEDETRNPFICHRLCKESIITLSSTSSLALRGPVKALKDRSLGFEHLAHAPGLDLPMDLCFDWVKRKVRDERWFAYLHVFYPHAPYEPPAEFRAGDSDFELYAAEVRQADFMLGKLVAGLKRDGWWDDTLLIVSADHGEEFYEHGRSRHGHNLYRESTHVPLYLLGGRVEPRRVQDLVSLIDLAPTLDQVFGLDASHRLDYQGRSWLPLAFGMKDPGRSAEVVIETPSFEQARTLPARTAVISATHSFTIDERRQRLYLYDLKDDPGELRNLATKKPLLARKMWARALSLRDRRRRQEPAADLMADLSQMLLDFDGQRRAAIAVVMGKKSMEHTATSRLFAAFALSKRYLPLDEVMEKFKDYPDQEVQDTIATLRVVEGKELPGDRDRMMRLWNECDDAIVLAAVAEGFRRLDDRRLLDSKTPELRAWVLILDLARMAYDGQFGRAADPKTLEKGLNHALPWVQRLAARMAAASTSPDLHGTVQFWRKRVSDKKLKHELDKASVATRVPKRP